MSKEITATKVTELAARAGITPATGHNFKIVTDRINEWAEDIKADIEEGAADATVITAADFFEALAEATAYDHIAEEIFTRSQAGEFDTWAPIWAAA